MKKIGFVGAYDKTDMILYIGKILKVLNKKVLIIDSTLSQKAKYIVPSINPTTTYITEYEEMDVAVGFVSLKQLDNYLKTTGVGKGNYDYILVDIDHIRQFMNFELQNADKLYFVTSFDVYSLKKGLDIIRGLQESTSFTKVIFSQHILKEDDDYLNYLARVCKVVWSEYKIYFPIDSSDFSAIAENQRLSKIKFRGLSLAYKEGLTYLVEDFAKEESDSKIRKAIKSIEKGV